MVQAPKYNSDFYSDAFISDPQPHYAAMRKLGPVIYLPKHNNFALTQFHTVKMALRNHRDFVSGSGVAADDTGAELLQGNIVASDPPRHTELRKAMMPTLSPKALEPLREQFDRLASHTVGQLLTRDAFNVIDEFAHVLPLTVVRELVGLPAAGKDNMLRWAGAAFNILGVQNDRGKESLLSMQEMRNFIGQELTAENAQQGSWAARIFDLVETGEISRDHASYLIRDHISPSLDTTIAAICHLVHQLSLYPDQWKLLRARPELIKKAISETIRLGSPIRSFARVAADDIEIEGILIPEGSRVMMLFASANRDEKMFSDSERFDIERPVSEHLGFGHGIHACVGMYLAQMEMQALLEAMISKVRKIEILEAAPLMNNTISGFSILKGRFH
jgi:cytochrome P450